MHLELEREYGVARDEEAEEKELQQRAKKLKSRNHQVLKSSVWLYRVEVGSTKGD